MAKINSKIDKALRKEVIENGVFLGHIASFGFNCNVYLYKNEVYRENFTINDDFVITDFARWTWYMVKSNITQFHPNEVYAEELIEYMTLYENSLYLSNKKYRELAKIDFAELKKDYQESGLLDDINALLKKSKSKTFRYSKYENKKNVGKSFKESNLPNKVYDVLNELASNFLLDYGEFVEFERNGLEHHFDKIRELGAKLKKADMKSDDDLYQKIADEIVTVVKRANGTLDESKKSARKSIKESNDFYFEVVFHRDVAKAKEYVKEIYNEFLKKYGYSKNDITWKLTSKGIGFSSSSENIGFDLEDYILDHMYEYGDYEFETDYELMESKKSARKSLKEMFGDEGIVDDFVDFLIYDCGYDKKTVEKYFYKKYKLNGLDTIPTKLYIKIKNEIEDALGYNDIM